jgi:hypothetical protein
MRGFRLNGWQRVGIVLSALWLVDLAFTFVGLSAHLRQAAKRLEHIL